MGNPKNTKADTPAPRTVATITTELRAAEAKLAARTKAKASTDGELARLKARLEDLRPEASDQVPAAVASLREVRGQVRDAEDDVETARVGVECAKADVARISADLEAAKAAETRAAYEQSKQTRIEAAGEVDRAVAGVIHAARAYLTTVGQSRALRVTREQDPRLRLSGALAHALRDGLGVDLPMPHVGFRASLRAIESIYTGESEDPQVVRQHAADAAAHAAAIREAPAIAERERLRQIARLKLRISRLAPHEAEAIADRAELRSLMAAEFRAQGQRDDTDLVTVSD